MLKFSLGNYAILSVIIGLNGFAFAKEPVISDTHTSFGPRITYSSPKDADSGSLFGGAQIRFGMSKSLKIEGSIDYRRNDYGRYLKVHVYPIQASIMAYFTPDKKISPYLLGGAGLYYSQIEGPFNFNYTTNRLGVHAGAGLEILLNDTLSIDFGYRHIWIEKFSVLDIDAMNKEYEDSGQMITIGLNFLF